MGTTSPDHGQLIWKIRRCADVRDLDAALFEGFEPFAAAEGQWDGSDLVWLRRQIRTWTPEERHEFYKAVATLPNQEPPVAALFDTQRISLVSRFAVHLDRPAPCDMKPAQRRQLLKYLPTKEGAARLAKFHAQELFAAAARQSEADK